MSADHESDSHIHVNGDAAAAVRRLANYVPASEFEELTLETLRAIQVDQQRFMGTVLGALDALTNRLDNVADERRKLTQYATEAAVRAEAAERQASALYDRAAEALGCADRPSSPETPESKRASESPGASDTEPPPAMASTDAPPREDEP